MQHGHASKGKSPTYNSWVSMKNRCSSPTATRWEHYGGAGIRVCDRWQSFENFLADMGERPANTSLGRIGDKGNYEPGNCEWQTNYEQGKKGSQNGRSKLTEEQVACIRSLYKPKDRKGFSMKNIAKDLGVGFATVDQAIRGYTWKNVK